jgi:hypothetical protein
MSANSTMRRFRFLLVGALLVPGAALPLPHGNNRFAEIAVSHRKIVLPSPTDRILERGRIDTNTLRGVYSMAIDVRPETADRGWALTVRPARSFFMPEYAGKPSTDVWWKLDEEPAGAWRPLVDDAEVVHEQPAGGEARVFLDIALDVGWETPPERYTLELLFDVRPR